MSLYEDGDAASFISAWPRGPDQYSNPKDEFAVIAFGDEPRLAAGFSDFSADTEAALQPLQAEGFTSLCDAIYMGLTEMRTAHCSRKAILVISDGGDNHSRYTQGETKSVLKEADVLLYVIDIYERYPKTTQEKDGAGKPGGANLRHRGTGLSDAGLGRTVSGSASDQ